MSAISNGELERWFDEGGDVMRFADVSTLRRPNQEGGESGSRISLVVPEGMAHGLDRAAERMGVNRQTVIKVWLAERLDEEADREARRLAMSGAASAAPPTPWATSTPTPAT